MQNTPKSKFFNEVLNRLFPFRLIYIIFYGLLYNLIYKIYPLIYHNTLHLQVSLQFVKSLAEIILLSGLFFFKI